MVYSLQNDIHNRIPGLELDQRRGIGNACVDSVQFWPIRVSPTPTQCCSGNRSKASFRRTEKCLGLRAIAQGYASEYYALMYLVYSRNLNLEVSEFHEFF